MDNSKYNEKMYSMLNVARQSSEMSGWNDKLSATLDSVHKKLEIFKAEMVNEAEKEERTL